MLQLLAATERTFVMQIKCAIALLLAFGLGVLAEASLGRAHAEPQAAFDRMLVERLVRASERQADATRELVSVTREAARR